MQIIITKHAKEKMIALVINLEDIKKAIIQCSKERQTEGFLSCYAYYCIAYKVIEEKVYKIKTIYLK